MKATALGWGALLGGASSILNHTISLGALASVVGSGYGWVLLGAVYALVLALQTNPAPFLRRVGAGFFFYFAACTLYYALDWAFALPGLMRLRRDVEAGRVPADGPINFWPDLSEWALWTAMGFPTALMVTLAASGLAATLPRRTRKLAQ